MSYKDTFCYNVIKHWKKKIVEKKLLTTHCEREWKVMLMLMKITRRFVASSQKGVAATLHNFEKLCRNLKKGKIFPDLKF